MALTVLQFFDLVGDRTIDVGDDPWTKAMSDLVRIVLLDNAGRMGESVAMIAPAVEAFRAIGDRWGLAMSVAQRATIEALDGRLAEALASWRESAALLTELGADDDADFSSLRVVALQLVAADADELGDLRRDIEASLERALGSGSRRLETMARMNLAALEHAAGHDEQAVVQLEHVLEHRDPTSEFGSGQVEALIRAQTAIARLGAGDVAGADRELVAAAVAGWTTKDMPVMAEVAVAAAVLAHHHGRDEQAALLLGASEVIRGRADLSNMDAVRLGERLMASLGVDAFARTRARGASMAQDEAVALLPRNDGRSLT